MKEIIYVFLKGIRENQVLTCLYLLYITFIETVHEIQSMLATCLIFSIIFSMKNEETVPETEIDIFCDLSCRALLIENFLLQRGRVVRQERISCYSTLIFLPQLAFTVESIG